MKRRTIAGEYLLHFSAHTLTELGFQIEVSTVKYRPRQPWNVENPTDGFQSPSTDVFRIDRGSPARYQNKILKTVKRFPILQIGQ